MFIKQTGNIWARKEWLPGLVEVYTENWGSGLSKQSFRSYYMLPSYNEKSLKENCNDWTLNRILPHIVVELRRGCGVGTHDLIKRGNRIPKARDLIMIED